MITTLFSLCAVPAPLWQKGAVMDGQRVSLYELVEDALAIEQRIKRDVNRENERARYNLCCARIEEAVAAQPLMSASTAEQFSEALAAHRLPTDRLEAGYLTALANLIPQSPADLRLGATFYPPDTVEKHVLTGHLERFYELANRVLRAGKAEDEEARQAVQRRARFFELARRNGCGVVELQNTFCFLEGAVVVPVETLPSPSSSNPLKYPEDNEAPNYQDRADLRVILREQIEKALRKAETQGTSEVNFSNAPHSVIPDVLNEFVYYEGSAATTGTPIEVVYADGSRARAPFPLRCLPRRSASDLATFQHVPPLRVSLMSMRHLAMDAVVDMAWFRNSEVSKSRTLAESDEFCYKQTLKELEHLRLRSPGAPLNIFLYQTGFQPAVIGFYRALVEELRIRASFPASLQVTPFYFWSNHNDYQGGHHWS